MIVDTCNILVVFALPIFVCFVAVSILGLCVGPVVSPVGTSCGSVLVLAQFTAFSSCGGGFLGL